MASVQRGSHRLGYSVYVVLFTTHKAIYKFLACLEPTGLCLRLILLIGLHIHTHNEDTVNY